MAEPIKFRGKWRIRWTNETGRRQSKVYRTFKEATRQLKLVEALVEEIKLGYRSSTPTDHAFNELCDYWITKVLPQKRCQRNDISIIRKHLRPSLGSFMLKNIGREHIDDYKSQRSHLDKKTIANHLTLLISMLNVAVELNWLSKAIKIKKPKIRMFSADYRFLKTNDEINRFLRAALIEGEHIYMFYATAIYTGARAGELVGLQRGDINFEKRIITIQRSFEGPTKGDDVRYVPILDPLLSILKEWFLKTQGKYLFPNEAGNMYQESAYIFQETLHRILDKAQFPHVQINGKTRRYIRFHDLRHTFASHWVMNGGDIFKLQKILGHKSIQMTQRYAHLAPEAFSADYGRLGSSLSIESAIILPIRATT